MITFSTLAGNHECIPRPNRSVVCASHLVESASGSSLAEYETGRPDGSGSPHRSLSVDGAPETIIGHVLTVRDAVDSPGSEAKRNHRKSTMVVGTRSVIENARCPRQSKGELCSILRTVIFEPHSRRVLTDDHGTTPVAELVIRPHVAVRVTAD